MDVPRALDIGARAIALGGSAFAAAVAATHWAVRRNALAPFGTWSKLVRRVSDPLLRPIEGQLARRGGNPQDAALWLLGLAIVAGLLLIALTRWLTGFVLALVRLGQSPPTVWLWAAVDWTFTILMMALIVRVIGVWFGLGRYSRWSAWAYRLTDWIVMPIQRVLPTFGMVDLSPLAAYVGLVIVRGLIGAALR